MRLLQYSGHIFISSDPVITTYMGTNQHAENPYIPRLPACIEADIILEQMSWHAPASTISAVKQRYDSCQDSIERLLIVNTADAEQARKNLKVPGFCCNAEIFQIEYVFRDFGLQPADMKYDAIYNARFAEFKRHYLANEVKNLRVLTGGNGESLGVGKGLEKITELSHGRNKDLLNKSVCFEPLSEEEVSAEINRSHCGLALSSLEGMMQASTEYLLCGRPVVSTRSRGGRDIYYTEENCRLVEDNPQAVLKGVEYWLKNPPDRKSIRRKILSQINAYRYFYSRQIAELQHSHGAEAERPERIFHDLFINPDVISRRYHAPASRISRNKLNSLLAYPEAEILFSQSDAYTRYPDGKGVIVESNQHQHQLDEMAAWILSQLKGVRTVSEIIDDLVGVYGNRDEISEAVRDAIAQFLALDIVTISNQPEQYAK